MMRLSSPTARSCWLHVFARVSTRRCCNCRAPGGPRLSPANKWCQREPPSSPDPTDVRESLSSPSSCPTSTKAPPQKWGGVFILQRSGPTYRLYAEIQSQMSSHHLTSKQSSSHSS